MSETDNNKKMSETSVESNNETGEELSLDQLRQKFSELYQENTNLKKKNEEDNRNYLILEDRIKKSEDEIEEVSSTGCCLPTTKKDEEPKLILRKDGSGDPFDYFKNLLQLLKDIKNELVKLSELVNNYEHLLNYKNQEKDDLLFYRSMICDSKNFFFPSFRIRKKKIVNDINKIIKMFRYEDIRPINSLDDKIVGEIKSHYSRLLKEVKDSSINVDTKWIKNNKVRSPELIRNELTRTFKYHLDINNHFYISIKNEVEFYNLNA